MLPPLHPLMVHFPIALLLAALALDLAGLIFKNDRLRKSAFPVLALAVLGAVAAVITGGIAHSNILRMPEDLHKLIGTHQHLATATLIISIAALALRTWAEYKSAVKGTWGHLALAVLCLSGIMVGITGFYGGKVVFDYGAGTAIYDKAYPDAPIHE